jgi:hypothetical protein
MVFSFTAEKRTGGLNFFLPIGALIILLNRGSFIRVGAVFPAPHHTALTRMGVGVARLYDFVKAPALHQLAYLEFFPGWCITGSIKRTPYHRLEFFLCSIEDVL